MRLRHLFGGKAPVALRPHPPPLWQDSPKAARTREEHGTRLDAWLNVSTTETVLAPPGEPDSLVASLEVKPTVDSRETQLSVVGAAGLSPWVVFDPATVTAENIQVRRHDGHTIALMLGADYVVRVFPPGWTPVLLYAGFEPLLLLELQHPEWGRASWYLTSEGKKIGDRVGDLPFACREQLRESVIDLFLNDVDAKIWQKAIGFWMLNGVTRMDIAKCCFEKDTDNIR